MRKFILILISLLIAGGIAYKLTANKKIINKSKQIDSVAIVIPVKSLTVSKQTVRHNLETSGTLIPFKTADINAASGGKLTTVNFEKGSFVRKGAVLAEIDNEMLRLSLAAAELAKDKAKTDLDRANALLEGDATTEINAQNIQFDYNNSQNKIAQIKKQISDNRILAPISGQVVTKLKEAGEYVTPGASLGHIVDVSQLKVDVLISEQDIYSIRKQDPVTVTTDAYPGIDFNGKIIFISESGDNVHNYTVEIALQNERDHPLKAGGFAYVNFHKPSGAEQILIPKSALIQSLDKPMVYVINGGKAIEKDITIGGSFGDSVTVVSGLKEGEQIITSGLVNVSPGVMVENKIDSK